MFYLKFYVRLGFTQKLSTNFARDLRVNKTVH